MFGTFDWTVDVLPVLQDFMANGLVKGGLIACVAIAIAALAGRGIVRVFFGRE